MTTRRLAAAALAALMAGGAARAADRPPGPHRLAAERLAAERRARRPDAAAAVPQTHATDFAGTGIGCITLSRREMRSFRYPGHAFVCEEGAAGEVLGAVLDRYGRRLCLIDGAYRGDDCYEITICGNAETLCVR